MSGSSGTAVGSCLCGPMSLKTRGEAAATSMYADESSETQDMMEGSRRGNGYDELNSRGRGEPSPSASQDNVLGLNGRGPRQSQTGPGPDNSGRNDKRFADPAVSAAAARRLQNNNPESFIVVRNSFKGSSGDRKRASDEKDGRIEAARATGTASPVTRVTDSDSEPVRSPTSVKPDSDTASGIHGGRQPQDTLGVVEEGISGENGDLDLLHALLHNSAPRLSGVSNAIINKRCHHEVTGKEMVLVVDDSKINQLVVKKILEPLGYKIEAAMDGQSALRFLIESPTLPDVMLLDIVMPGLSGFEVCTRVRALWPESRLPIILLSANTEEQSVSTGLKLGCNDYVRKPVKSEELAARVSTQLRLKDVWKLESDAHMLRSMLPEEIITRLGQGETDIADAHNNITVLFSDVVGFTEMCTYTPTREVVRFLNEMFRAFDALVDKHDVYKVDMIGDAYFCIAGHLDNNDPSHASRILSLAKEMLKVVSEMKLPVVPGRDSAATLRIRIGIHSGPAYAGVIGAKCPRYTFFGDTVNVASRMESHGFPTCIHLSADCLQQLVAEGMYKESEFVNAGMRYIKGKGIMTTHLAKTGDYKVALDTWARENQKSNAKDDGRKGKKGGAGSHSNNSQSTTARDSRDHDAPTELEQAGVRRTRRASVEILTPPPVDDDDTDTGPRGSSQAVVPGCLGACFGRRAATGARHQVVPEGQAGPGQQRLQQSPSLKGGAGPGQPSPQGNSYAGFAGAGQEKSPGRGVGR